MLLTTLVIQKFKRSQLFKANIQIKNSPPNIQIKIKNLENIAGNIIII